MKKLLLSLVLLGCTFTLYAEQPSLNLVANQQLVTTAVKQLVVSEGVKVENYWFEVSPDQLEGTSQAEVSNCAVSTDIVLADGKLNVETKQIRCINDIGDVFTNQNFSAQFKASTNQLCTSNRGKCVEATLYSGSSYSFEVVEATSLIAELNIMREVNKARLFAE